MKQVTLPKNTHYFEKTGYALARTDRGLSAGSIINIGDPEPLYYDHRIQIAVPFTFYDQTYYMIVSEMDMPELNN